MVTAPPHTKAYLLQNKANPIFTAAELELNDTHLRCTATEHAKWLDKELGIEDGKERVATGNFLVAFDFRRDQLSIKWLMQFGRGGFEVQEGDSRKWVVSLVYPTGYLSVLDLLSDGGIPSSGGRRCRRSTARQPSAARCSHPRHVLQWPARLTEHGSASRVRAESGCAASLYRP